MLLTGALSAEVPDSVGWTRLISRPAFVFRSLSGLAMMGGAVAVSCDPAALAGEGCCCCGCCCCCCCCCCCYCGEGMLVAFGSGTAGRIGLPAGTKMSSASTSVTDSVARVSGGVAARGGDATFLSGESDSIAGSGSGEVMEECVCLVWMASLHEKG